MTETRPSGGADLSRRLKAWRAPEAPAHLDARVYASYRDGLWRRPVSWRTLLTSSVRVPLPVAAAAALLCLLSLLVALGPLPLGPERPRSAISLPLPAESPVNQVPDKDLSGFEPTREMTVTILYPGDAR